MAKQMTQKEIDDYVRISNAMAEEKRRSVARRSLMIATGGLLFFIIGLAITLFSYHGARGGGIYVIAWGAILFGFLDFIIGIRKWWQNKI